MMTRNEWQEVYSRYCYTLSPQGLSFRWVSTRLDLICSCAHVRALYTHTGGSGNGNVIWTAIEPSLRLGTNPKITAIYLVPGGQLKGKDRAIWRVNRNC